MCKINNLRKTKLLLFLKLMLMVVMLSSFSACATVKPWEREYLADEIMTFDADPLQSSRHLHMTEVLEGSRGGFAGSGGGCGCK